MAFMRPIPIAPAMNANPEITPLPQPAPQPVLGARSAVSTFGQDRIERPNAQPSPTPHAMTASGPGDALPLLIAGAVILGGAAIVAAPVIAEGGAVAEGAVSLGASLARSRTFAVAAGREFASEYRGAAAKATNISFSDPKELGKALGAQSWTATEELVRGTIVGAALAGGASAVQRASTAIGDLIERDLRHVPTH